LLELLHESPKYSSRYPKHWMPAAKVIDKSSDEPITCIYPTRSVFGVPQVFDSSA
jgi:hypothetical protein